MKILKLRLQNLNSLYGEWVIDFTDPRFQDAGLFAITGPTGGGKSTVLDAICLALYGETPRLKSINATTNDLMSRHTGESFSELEYEVNGKQYLSRWYQKRARGKAEGALQSVKREISVWDDAKGKYEGIASKITAVAKAVQQVTRMDFERFTRSILLAQGNFAAFLEADDDARAGLLEQITGTDIYTLISKRVHERCSLEAQGLKDIEARMSGVDLLSAEELEKLSSERVQLTEKTQKLTRERKGLVEKIHWLEGVSQLEKKRAANVILVEAQKERAKQFKGKKIQLDTAIRASKVDPAYLSVSNGRQDLVVLEKRRKAISKDLLEKKQELEEREKSVDKVTSEHASTVLDLERMKSIWTQVRALDTKLEGMEQQLDGSQKKLISSKELLDKERGKLAKLESLKEGAIEELRSTQEYLEGNSADKLAFEKSEVIQSYISQWLELSQRSGTQENKLKETEAKIVKGKTLISELKESEEESKAERAGVERRFKALESQLKELLDGKQLSEYERECKHLYEKKEYEAKIQSLEAHRAQLEGGEPCPLCGSEHHPFAEEGEHVDQTSILQSQIKEVEKVIKQVNLTEKDVAQASNQIKILMKNEQQIISKLSDYEKRLNELGQELADLESELKEQASKLSKVEGKLRAEAGAVISVEEFTQKTLEKVVIKVSSRADQWKEATVKAEPLQKEILRLEGELSVQQVKLASIAKAGRDSERELDELKKQQGALFIDRRGLFGEKVVNSEEAESHARLKKIAEEMNSVRNIQHRLEKELGQLEQSLMDTADQITIAGTKLKNDDDSLLEVLRSQQFDDEKTYLAARLSEQELGKLTEENKAIQSEGERLSALSQSYEKDLEQQRERQLTTDSIEKLISEQEEVDVILTEKNQQVGRINASIAAHEKNLSRQAKDAELKAAQQEVLRTWKHLHELIGSADGKKFRNYAQGLTFEWVVSFANKQLESISDRYILVRDKNAPLQLNVLDDYQGGEERSTKNLSGGESFLISLALALGLSQMVSDNIQMDSLFLDEGFGTLDEDTLELAMEALSSLRQEGKLIGVISHVQELKERLTTQIIVKPQSGGKSELSGAGVSQIR